MLNVADPQAPLTVRVAAFMMVAAAVLEFTANILGDLAGPAGSSHQVWWPLRQVLSLAVELMMACLLVLLNGLAYWFTVIMAGFALLFLTILAILVLLGVVEHQPFVNLGVVMWCELVFLLTTFVLLVLKPSRHAPWSISKPVRERRRA